MKVLVYDIKDKEHWEIWLKPNDDDDEEDRLGEKEYHVGTVLHREGEEVLFEISRELRDRYMHPILNHAYNTVAIESDGSYIDDDIEFISIQPAPKDYI